MAGHAEDDATRRCADARERGRGVASDALTDKCDDQRVVSALILCGGQSRRMGTDKALISVDGRTLLEHAVRTLARWTPNVRLACGPSPRYQDRALPLSLDRWPDAGPLAGIEAGLSDVQPGWCLVLACDMPRVDPALFGAMLSRAIEGGLDVCWLESDGGVEPLCGVYHTRVVAAVRAALSAGERKVTSFTKFPLETGSETRVLRIERYRERTARVNTEDSAHVPCTTNLNTPEDLRALDVGRGVSPDAAIEGDEREIPWLMRKPSSLIQKNLVERNPA